MSDLIDRQKAIEVIDAIWTVTGDKNVAKAWDQIKNLPSEEPKRGKWIPCNERLPEVNGRYLVTRGLNACGSLWNRIYIANYSDLMGLKSERIWWNGNVGKSDFERIDDVIAWMPLPKPYNRADMRGEEDEQTAKEKTT